MSDQIGQRGPDRLWFWPEGLGRVSSLSLRRELIATLPIGIMGAVLTPQFYGLIGRKALRLNDTQYALLMATLAVGLLCTGPLVGIWQGRRKVGLVCRSLLVISVAMAAVGLTPWPVGATGEGGFWQQYAGYVFIAQVLIAHLALALLTSLRSSVWRANYPVRQRAQVVVLIGILMKLCSAAAVFLFSRLLDWQVSFRTLFFVSAVFGVLGAYLFSRLRVRHERRQFRQAPAEGPPQARLWAGLAVLVRDGRFRTFMSWQMLNGLSVMSVEFILVVIVTDVFASTWLVEGLILVVVPMLVAAPAGIVWARIFDRTDIYRMRFYSACFWIASRLLLGLGIFYHSLALVFISRVITGIARGGGDLNWRLGHMEFAPAEQDSLYMGAHLSLTGMRALVAPFLGMALYKCSFSGPDGVWFILGTAGVTTLAALGFLYMRRTKGVGVA